MRTNNVDKSHNNILHYINRCYYYYFFFFRTFSPDCDGRKTLRCYVHNIILYIGRLALYKEHENASPAATAKTVSSDLTNSACCVTDKRFSFASCFRLRWTAASIHLLQRRNVLLNILRAVLLNYYIGL